MKDFSELKNYLFNSLHQFIQSVNDYLPNLFGALMLLIIGLLVAWMAKWLIKRLGDAIDRIIQLMGMSHLQLRLKWAITDILAWLAYWVIVLLFVRAALDSLNLPSLVDMLGRLFTFLPNIFVATLIIAGGTLFANSVREKIHVSGSNMGLQQSELLAGIVRFIIIILSVIIGLAQIGLDVGLLEQILTISFAAMAGSIALAFGLGAGSTVSNIISSKYVRKNYQVGQRIRIQKLEGKVLEILPGGVMLDTKSGRTFIPANIFNEEASILLDNENIDEH
jgi:small-conductance mechanosensitive channel